MSLGANGPFLLGKPGFDGSFLEAEFDPQGGHKWPLVNPAWAWQDGAIRTDGDLLVVHPLGMLFYTPDEMFRAESSLAVFPPKLLSVSPPKVIQSFWLLHLLAALAQPAHAFRSSKTGSESNLEARLAQECGNEDTRVQVEGGMPPSIWEVQDLKRRPKKKHPKTKQEKGRHLLI